FDTSKFPSYGKLARLNLQQQKEGARIEKLDGKRNAADFALWKFERPGENRAMTWDSPWHPRSFPGWHIECSAMAKKYLGEQFEIHTGGIDHIPVHHTNEIAQAEALTSKEPFVKYWVHHNFVRIEGEKMSKSLGNFFTIDDVVERGINPRALRMLFLTTHYRSELNFTWENLAGAQKSYERLVHLLRQFKMEQERTVLSQDKLAKIDQYRERFLAALANDLDTSTAIALLWEVAKSNIPGPDKYDLLVEFDEVLALDLKNMANQVVPAEIERLRQERDAARQRNDWQESDRLRDQVQAEGYIVRDTAAGTVILPGSTQK
ncbi:class I tRNA ligase family protein, partial [Candidatus Woesebacteria bacterium]|nr:class I tRNA ligase family protein [Candidatus Woesebacteria bacterium]